MRSFIISVVLSVVVCEEKVFRVVGDSYVEAYKASHRESLNALLDNAIKKTDREYVEPYPSYPYPGPQYPQPAPNYGPPIQQYGPPTQSYGPPQVYGPPPVPVPVYGPPSSNVQVFYGVPHALGSLWDKLKFKLDLFTLGKILLKLVIFKKIVSFIAIICLLLFIPWIKKKHQPNSSEEDDGRSNLSDGKMLTYEDLNNITTYILDAIEKFPVNNNTSRNCNNVYCKTNKLLKKMHKKMS